MAQMEIWVKTILTIRMFLKILCVALFMGLVSGTVFVVYAATPLNTSSREYDYNEGRPRWLIDRPGDYYLDIPENTFYTTNYYAIRIQCSNVTLDGRGKTITGSGPPPTPNEGNDICGVLVNSGPRTYNITIKNLTVEKKFYGILFEWIYNGKVESCITNGNVRGITLWNSENSTLTGNIANDNNQYGIEFDANNCINIGNIVINNKANNNALSGIILHLENNNNKILNNITNYNGNRGIYLPNGSNYNEISGNTSDYNSIAGIVIENSHNNTLEGNYMRNNGDRGLWLFSANNNIIFNNYFNNPDDNVTFAFSNTGNQWNTGRTEGTNILGGPYLGGNFWGNPQGTGFSQITGDVNKDGICDSAYTISGGNVDQYPLHAYEVAVVLTVPTVVTSDISSISCNTASSGGDVTSSGGDSVTARGVCWSTTENPTINDSHTTDGTGTGVFQSSISGLEPGATYYLRAYATNSTGTGYGRVARRLPLTHLMESFT
jgi:parallel beta-helix repeat protein